MTTRYNKKQQERNLELRLPCKSRRAETARGNGNLKVGARGKESAPEGICKADRNHQAETTTTTANEERRGDAPPPLQQRSQTTPARRTSKSITFVRSDKTQKSLSAEKSGLGEEKRTTPRLSPFFLSLFPLTSSSRPKRRHTAPAQPQKIKKCGRGIIASLARRAK